MPSIFILILFVVALVSVLWHYVDWQQVKKQTSGELDSRTKSRASKSSRIRAGIWALIGAWSLLESRWSEAVLCIVIAAGDLSAASILDAKRSAQNKDKTT